MNRDSLHARHFRGIHLSFFGYRLTKNGFAGPKKFLCFRETGPRFDEGCPMRTIVILTQRNPKQNLEID